VVVLKVKSCSQVNILGVRVDRVGMTEAVEKLEKVIKGKGKARVVTVNPEMVLAAQEDEEFLKILNGADLSVADGVGIIAAAKYLQLVRNPEFRIQNSEELLTERNGVESKCGVNVMSRTSTSPARSKEDGGVRSVKNEIQKIFHGLRVGWAIVSDRKFLDVIPEQVPGDILFAKLIERASKLGWEIFLLGGKPGVAEEAGRRLEEKYPGLKWQADAGAENIRREIRNPKSEIRNNSKFQSTKVEMNFNQNPDKDNLRANPPAGGEVENPEPGIGPRFSTSLNSNNDRVVQEINNYRPQLLFVAYGVPWEEIWLARNWDKLRVNVGIGIGGTLDEAAGVVSPTPEWMRRRGLRWLWRLIRQPRKRWIRIWRATAVFGWRVFKITGEIRV
jgi:UDP-N-acetyl-D-mannosaminuronic acid transferase (WecB/TagA/CpsF family)